MKKTTFYVGDDNLIKKVESTAIVEGSNMVDQVRFIIPAYYNDDLEMSDYDVALTYKTPISGSGAVINLVKTDNYYEDDQLFNIYTFPSNYLTTRLTGERGDLKFTLQLTSVSLDENGKTVEHVRFTQDEGVITILPRTNLLAVSDQALDSIAAMYVENKKTALLLSSLAENLQASKADGLMIDTETEGLYLTANGEKIGDPIDLETLNQLLVSIGGNSTNNGNVSLQQI